MDLNREPRILRTVPGEKSGAGDGSEDPAKVEQVQETSEISNLVTVRSARVDRTLTRQQVLDASGCEQVIDQEDVVATIPCGEGEEVEVVFFKPDPEAFENGVISDAALEKEYEKRGLLPDPYAQCKVNGDDPDFAGLNMNGCQWKDENGNYCRMHFYPFPGGNRVRVRRMRNGVWDEGLWIFGGVRKKKAA